mmetsp:Transcript_14491/g.17621  ORF Transcript_14491/g.17621 Transcript_14491/m.17621 type:complete len:420 (+) Transcript_14491:211-1470(+)
MMKSIASEQNLRILYVSIQIIILYSSSLIHVQCFTIGNGIRLQHSANNKCLKINCGNQSLFHLRGVTTGDMNILERHQRRNGSKTANKSSLQMFSRQKEEVCPKEDNVQEKRKIKRIFFQSSEKSSSSSSSISSIDEIEKENAKSMGDLVTFMKGSDDANIDNYVGDEESSKSQDQSLGTIIGIGGLVTASLGLLTLNALGVSLPEASEVSNSIQFFFDNPTSSLEAVVESVKSMGPLGYFYFAAVYTTAEILAIPAIPLTASAGYLFGLKEGTLLVLFSASIAASISFLIGRTFLRSYVEIALENYPDFKKIDRAIGEEGFKLMLLLRLSPLFPFALSNYFYGATRIGFWEYFFGTMIGFTPGTIAYVYTGEIGKSLTLDAAGSEPWYVYAGLLLILSGFLKIVADVATGVIDKMDEY